MPIDVVTFEQLHDRGTHLLHVADGDVALLRPAFAAFERTTGRRIDEFGTTPFPQGTLPPLLAILREWLTRPDSAAQARALREVVGVLASADRDGIGVVLDGA